MLVSVLTAMAASSAAPPGPMPTATSAAANEPIPDPREILVPPIATAFPQLPGPEALPVQHALPDIFRPADGHRVTTPDQWRQRRAELRRILEHYAVGHAPPAPGNVRGRELKSQLLVGGNVRYRLIHLSFGPNESLGFDLGVFTPTRGTGPFPAVMVPAGTPPGATPLPRLPNGPTQGKGTNVLLVVGRGAPADASTARLPPSGLEPKSAAPKPASTATPGAIPSDAPATVSAVSAAPARRFPGAPADAEQIAADSLALARGYAYVMFNYNDLGEDTTLRAPDGSWSFRTTRFFPAYPGHDWGLLGAWAWGVSRIVDYLQTDPAIDASRLIVTGASRTGKSALVAAAFDERIALGAPVVTGGGGIGVYRLCGDGRSETLDIMEKKYPNWFSPHLHAFRGQVDRLPFDQHWFLALCAPRPFIALEGTTDVISSPAAVRASVDAARPAYALSGASDKLAVHYSDHGHTFNADDWNALLDFADQHLPTRAAPPPVGVPSTSIAPAAAPVTPSAARPGR
ncbi:hypothetical protein DB354_01475 [Opitutus sp. ER46]|nr:hypothetical protein DB354_01475 [Opitutus sp. ER46]